jgi:hypothetical protein
MHDLAYRFEECTHASFSGDNKQFVIILSIRYGKTKRWDL